MKKLLVAVIILWAITGCTVTNDDILAAETMCRPNGGLKSITNSNARFQTIVCNNGAKFVHIHDIFR